MSNPATQGHDERTRIIERHAGEILAAWTFPASPPSTSDPVVVVADPADPVGARIAAGMRAAGLTRSPGPVVVGTVSAGELATHLERLLPHQGTPLRRLRAHSLFVVVLAGGGVSGGYFTTDPTTGRLCPVPPTTSTTPPARRRFDVN